MAKSTCSKPCGSKVFYHFQLRQELFMLPSTTTGPQHSSQFMNFHSAQCHSSTAVALNQFFIAHCNAAQGNSCNSHTTNKLIKTILGLLKTLSLWMTGWVTDEIFCKTSKPVYYTPSYLGPTCTKIQRSKAANKQTNNLRIHEFEWGDAPSKCVAYPCP